MKKLLIKIILSSALGCLLLIPFIGQTAYEIEVSIPQMTETEPDLLTYLRYIYLFGLGLVGIAALAALVYGGFNYMLSGTITSKEEAKKYIWGAISGLLLALAAYLILNTINPDLVSWHEPCHPGHCPAQCEIPCEPNYSWDFSSCQCIETAGP